MVEGDETSNSEYKAVSGFGEYFAHKQIKLDTQRQVDTTKVSNAFRGCVIYITGYTVPSSSELQRLIVAHGGKVCAFLAGKSYATHIVAESLTSRKTEQYAKYKVVKPAWIIESAKAGRQLDWHQFRTFAGNNFWDHMYHNKPPNEGGTNDLFEHEGIMGEETLQEEVEDQVDDSDINLDTALEEPGSPGVADNIDSNSEAQIQWILRERDRVNCLSDDFISSYYSRSRLHFLSIRKQLLRARCRELPTRRMPEGKRMLLHVDFDSFFVSVALQKRPDLRDQPVCVSWGGSSSDIASANYVARAYGVRNGMWVGRARQLCSKIVCLPYDFEAYERYSDALYSVLMSLGADYILAISVDEAIVDVSSICNRDEDVGQLMVQISGAVRNKTGIEVSVGAGPNLLLARVALKLAKPAGTRLIWGKEALAELPVRDLPGVGYATSEKLSTFGINRVAELEKWGFAALQSHFGRIFGMKLFRAAQGLDSDDLVPLDQPPKSVGVEIGWGVRVVSADEASKFVDSLVTELAGRLIDARLIPDVLTVRVYRRTLSAKFLPPKYMGHGLCDISTKSHKLQTQWDLSYLRKIVHTAIDPILCPPLELRGVGLHIKVCQQRPTPSAFAQPVKRSPPTTPTREKDFVQLQPRRRQSKRGGATLTQMLEPPPQSTLDVDRAVFDELPTTIQKEIIESGAAQFRVKSPSPPFVTLEYQPVELAGIKNFDEIRGLLQRWVHQFPTGPCIEDVRRLTGYIEDIFSRDWNWLKAVELVEWLKEISPPGSPAWLKLLEILNNMVSESLRRNDLL